MHASVCRREQSGTVVDGPGLPAGLHEAPLRVPGRWLHALQLLTSGNLPSHGGVGQARVHTVPVADEPGGRLLAPLLLLLLLLVKGLGVGGDRGSALHHWGQVEQVGGLVLQIVFDECVDHCAVGIVQVAGDVEASQLWLQRRAALKEHGVRLLHTLQLQIER